jgi:hypothetical protein
MPDVQLARRAGVELIRTGSWSASTGSWNPTRQDILAAVEAQKCPAVRRPRLKLGHTDERFNGDGEPALGWFENLRAGDGGHTLVADQVALPWLNQVQAAAYPDRSIEGAYRYRCGLGHEHPFVLTAVALLGVTPPAVSTLKSVQDLPDMLGVAAAEDVPDGAEHVEVTIHATRQGVTANGEDATPMSRAQLIRDAWNASNPPLSQWVTEARPDAAVVVDDEDRSYRLYPVTWDGDKPAFGESRPYDPAADQALVYASRAESRPGDSHKPALPPDPDRPTPELPAAEPEPEETPNKEDIVSLSDDMRSRLGLADDADETAALAAIDELKQRADNPQPNPELVAASAAVEAEKNELRKEVTILASQVQTMSTKLAEAEAEKAAATKHSVIQAAADLGKITPDEREQWEKDYDDAPAAVTRILASIAPGYKLPVSVAGSAGGPEPTAAFDDDQLTEAFFGPGAVARFKTQEA